MASGATSNLEVVFAFQSAEAPQEIRELPTVTTSSNASSWVRPQVPNRPTMTPACSRDPRTTAEGQRPSQASWFASQSRYLGRRQWPHGRYPAATATPSSAKNTRCSTYLPLAIHRSAVWQSTDRRPSSVDDHPATRETPTSTGGRLGRSGCTSQAGVLHRARSNGTALGRLSVLRPDDLAHKRDTPQGPRSGAMPAIVRGNHSSLPLAVTRPGSGNRPVERHLRIAGVFTPTRSLTAATPIDPSGSRGPARGTVHERQWICRPDVP